MRFNTIFLSAGHSDMRTHFNQIIAKLNLENYVMTKLNFDLFIIRGQSGEVTLIYSFVLIGQSVTFRLQSNK